MTSPRSDVRQTLQDEAFARLDALDVTALEGVSLVRIAALAATTVQYVDSWIIARDHTNLKRRGRGKRRNK